MAKSRINLIQEDNLCEIIHNLPFFFVKAYKGYKERDAVTNAWEEITKSLAFTRDGTYYSVF